MNRRDFLKCSGKGLAAIAVGQTVLPKIFADTAQAAVGPIQLTIVDAMKEMVDKTPLFHYAFSNQAFGPRVPGPVLVATEGDLIELRITNLSHTSHAFKVSDGYRTPPIPANKSLTFRFEAPAAGSYIYYDPLRDPVNRVLGLYGALIVKPAAGNNPYGAGATPNVAQLFNDLGVDPWFPGRPWAPSGEDNREKIWLFSQADPRYNLQALQERLHGELVIDPQEMRTNFLPRYFMINGRSGAFASHEVFPDEVDRGYAILPIGFIGEPHVVRMLNPGIFSAHSPHIHGNHFYLIGRNGAVIENVWNLDTYSVHEMERIDVLLPFIRPKDIPNPRNLPLRELIPQEIALIKEKLHLADHHEELGYPMHTHEEQAQTAAGGNYPQGAVTHGMTFVGEIIDGRRVRFSGLVEE
jgi:FtsP/CotA-like multicopper oxidase with cupredoxin domain